MEELSGQFIFVRRKLNMSFVSRDTRMETRSKGFIPVLFIRRHELCEDDIEWTFSFPLARQIVRYLLLIERLVRSFVEECFVALAMTFKMPAKRSNLIYRSSIKSIIRFAVSSFLRLKFKVSFGVSRRTLVEGEPRVRGCKVINWYSSVVVQATRSSSPVGTKRSRNSEACFRGYLRARASG